MVRIEESTSTPSSRSRGFCRFFKVSYKHQDISPLETSACVFWEQRHRSVVHSCDTFIAPKKFNVDTVLPNAGFIFRLCCLRNVLCSSFPLISSCALCLVVVYLLTYNASSCPFCCSILFWSFIALTFFNRSQQILYRMPHNLDVSLVIRFRLIILVTIL